MNETNIDTPKFTDLTPMPFGKYKGTPLQDVPASYLHWWWTSTSRPHDQLAEYIKDNIKALKDEYPDGVWT